MLENSNKLLFAPLLTLKLGQKSCIPLSIFVKKMGRG